MWKQLAIGLCVATIGATSLAWAQQKPSTTGATPSASSGPTKEDIAALADARMAALKTGLKLKPEQEKAWSSFATAIQNITKQRQERIAELIKERQDAGKAAEPSPADVYRLRAKALTGTATELTQYADAIDPLYKSLDDAQKRRMLVLLGGIMPRR